VKSNFRRVLAVFLSLAISVLGVAWPSSALAGNNPKTVADKTEVPLAGQLLVNGSVTINGKKAITGTTVLTNSRIDVACASGNNATVNLGKLGRVELGPGAQMIVRFTDGLISGELVSGKAVVSNANGVKVSINTPDGVSAADGKEASVLAVNTQKGTRCVPMTATGSSGGVPGNFSAGAIAATIVGVGGMIAVVATAVSQKDLSASSPLP
jgi:hypothetical protein